MKIAYKCNNYEDFATLFIKYVKIGNPKLSWDCGINCVTEDGYCGREWNIVKRWKVEEV